MCYISIYKRYYCNYRKNPVNGEEAVPPVSSVGPNFDKYANRPA